MRFIVDAQLPPALARILSCHGYHAEHVGDFGMRDAEDSPIWSYALELDALVVTKDEDFPHRLSQNPHKAPVASGSKSATPVAELYWLGSSHSSRKSWLSVSEEISSSKCADLDCPARSFTFYYSAAEWTARLK